MSAPSGPKPNNRRFNGKGGGNHARSKAQNIKYGTPLPILLPPSALHPAHVPPPPRFFSNQTEPVKPVPLSAQLEAAIKRVKFRFAQPEIPLCRGIYDKRTRSVWVTSRADREILFERGFFGKGSLSRSDPSWHTRRVKVVLQERLAERSGGKERGLTSEEVTALRRKERKQFKIDRAQAMLDASLAAERILTAAGASAESSTATATAKAVAALQSAKDEEEEGEEEDDENEAGPSQESPLQRIPSSSSIATSQTMQSQIPLNAEMPAFKDYAHALPEGTTRLTPQTFLVRPTRPSVRVGPRPVRPPKPTSAVKDGVDESGKSVTFDQEAEEAAAVEAARKEVVRLEMEKLKQEEEELEKQVEDLEHLQLTLEEAFFLTWGLGCLVITDQETGRDLTALDFLATIFALQQPRKIFTLKPDLENRPDHPFLVAYAAYHHYRSMGWVVKTGIKFCVDFLLYKKGLVFSHAEFAMLVIPHYSDEEDRKSSPFILPNGDPMSWQWLNTVNRVNTQVKKTLILAYVVIPSIASISEKDWASPERLFSKFAVREITIRRFVAARMRD